MPEDWFSASVLPEISTCLCPKYKKYCFQNLVNGREDKNGHIDW